MDVHIEGDPGTGNTFHEVKVNQEIHIGSVQNYHNNPQATTVIYYNDRQVNGGTPAKGKADSKSLKSPIGDDPIDTNPIRQEILNYVNCLLPFIKEEKKDEYLELWDDVLDLKKVASIVYDPGKQQGTSFNRKLVASILHLLDSQHFYAKPYNAKVMAEALEDDWEHPVRLELGTYPSTEITDDILNLLNKRNNPDS